MLRTQKEIVALARAVVSGIVADMMAEFPAVEEAIDDADRGEWREFLDRKVDDLHNTLLNKFDSKD